jgi:hypothetical protein
VRKRSPKKGKRTNGLGFRKLVLGAIAMAVAFVAVNLGYIYLVRLGKPRHTHRHVITLTVEGMEDGTVVMQELEKVNGVEQVTADLKAGTLTITTKPNKQPSPRELWEAAERAKVQPVKLTRAHDEFTEKPKK